MNKVDKRRDVQRKEQTGGHRYVRICMCVLREVDI